MRLLVKLFVHDVCVCNSCECQNKRLFWIVESIKVEQDAEI